MDMTDLDGLSATELKQLQDQIAFKLSGTKAVPTPDEQDVWTALVTAMDLRGRQAPPVQVFMKAYGRAKYAEGVLDILDYIKHATSEAYPMRRPVRNQLLVECFRLLVNRLEQRDITVSPTSMMNSMGQLAQAVDHGYPGYARARMLDRIIVMANPGGCDDD